MFKKTFVILAAAAVAAIGAFKDVAAKYKDNKDAEATLATKLKEGKGHPTKVAASDAELKALVQYSLTGK